MPPVAERLELARRTLVGLVSDAELPAKIAVHPRPAASFGHAMPAYLRGPAPDASADLLGIKWVVGFPTNAGLAIPAIHATVLLSDPSTGRPRAILDGGPITAHRTAAISGVAIAAWAPDVHGRARRVALVGAGVQARSHLPILAHVLPGAALIVTDISPERADQLADEARATEAFSDVRTAPGSPEAVEGADIVITLVSFGPDRQAIPADAFAPDALIVAVDYDMSVPAAVAEIAGSFLIDERAQFAANRATGIFAGYRDPDALIGEALVDGTRRPASGRVLVTHLGTGLADLVFADVIVRAAEERGSGVLL